MGSNAPSTASITVTNIGSLGSARAGMGEAYANGYYYAGGMSTGQYNVQSCTYTGNHGLMEYKSFMTTADGVFFGNKNDPKGTHDASSNGYRGMFTGGDPGADTVEYINLTSPSNSVDFGEAGSIKSNCGSQSDGVYHYKVGGKHDPASSDVTTIEYLKFAAGGTSAAEFGNLSQARTYGSSGINNGYRAFTLGGSVYTGSWTHYDTMDYFTFRTGSTAIDWGECIHGTNTNVGESDGSRGVTTNATSENMQYFNIGSEGKAADFGEQPIACGSYGNGASGG
jgi:hypothetical protein